MDYSSPDVTSGFAPSDFRFSVHDVQQLTLAFYGEGTGTFLSSTADFAISNPVAQKAFPKQAY